MSEDERGLVRRAQNGDVQAFETLIRPYQTTLYRLALSVTGNADDAEDAFQEAVVHVYRAIGKFRGDASFSTWLYRIALNASRNWVRSQLRGSTDRFLEKAAPNPEGQCAGPEQGLISREQAKLAHDALLRLPDHYREVLVLRHYEDLSYDQIASVLDIPLGTVRSRLAQGRKCLLVLLQADELPAQGKRR